MVAPDDVRIDALSVYEAALDTWAAETMSSPEPRWRGPGVYRYGGYLSDENRPIATLEKTRGCALEDAVDVQRVS